MPSLRVCKRQLLKQCARAEATTASESSNVIELHRQNLQKDFETYQQVVSDNLEEADDEATSRDYDEVEERVNQGLCHLARLAQPSLPSVPPSPLCATSSSQTANPPSVLSQPTRTIIAPSLPKLEVPRFNGDRDQWVPFRDLFRSLVHCNEQLDDIQRFHYLRGSVHGEAESLIRTLPVTATNYPSAWNILMETYDKPILIVEAILKKFLCCKSVSTDHANFRPTYHLFRETIELLSHQGTYANSRDPIFIIFMLQKLDSETDRAWAAFSRTTPEPSLSTFLDFLRDQCQIHERRRQITTLAESNYSSRRTIKLNTIEHRECFCCKEFHTIFQCKKFLALPIASREKLIKRESRCFNCFSKGHSLKLCKSTKNCLNCSQRHHTLLHRQSLALRNDTPINTNPSPPTINDEFNPKTVLPTHGQGSASNILQINSSQSGESTILPTVVVNIIDDEGTLVPVRALLDTGAQSSFISNAFLQKINANREQSRVPVSCIMDNKIIYSKGKTTLKIKSRVSNDLYEITAHVLPRLLGPIPHSPITIDQRWEIDENFILADPEFNLPQAIDLILGGSFLFEILKTKRFIHVSNQLIIQETALGYVICNGHVNSPVLSVNSCTTPEPTPIDNQLLERFWTLEEPPTASAVLSTDDHACELHFETNVHRLPSGRFSVRLPFKMLSTTLGTSVNAALSRFQTLERKFNRDQPFHREYVRFMNEYESLGHMEDTKWTIDQLPENYYIIPHHGIFQSSLNTTKLRVVFDASAPTSTGFSLNNILHTGPRLQSDIIQIIIRFRFHKYVITTDIEKMYRQVLVDQADQPFQLILWRSNPLDPIKIFRLTTVTYGESCSPYLALRTLQELAEQEKSRFPNAAKILKNGTYVDDLFFGDDSLDNLLSLKSEVIQLLKCGCFPLKKWAANHPTLLQSIAEVDMASPHIFQDNALSTLRTLGILWAPMPDTFSYQIQFNDRIDWTKRSLLSDTARLFDPLGWISPIVMKLKCLFQDTWVRKLSWDAPLPDDMISLWQSIRLQLPLLSQIAIPRYFESGIHELHGFADASKMAYAAVIYVRTQLPDNTFHSSLLISKTKLAPIKPTSIPRLELCAAHLLAKLMKYIKVEFPSARTVLYSDSTCVLSWLHSLPRNYTTFVANRVGHIQDLCPEVKWRYVKSKDNPADVASRGLLPAALIECKTWWEGPQFLRNPDLYVHNQITFSTNEEVRPTKLHLNSMQVSREFWIDFISRFSSFNRLIHTLCYVQRWFQRRRNQYSSLSLNSVETTGALTLIIQSLQSISFADELHRLKSDQTIPKGSQIRSLHPFVDTKGFLRAGGRLQNHPSDLFNSNPIILPKGHFSDLIITKCHLDSFHGNFDLICTQIRQTYWILNLRRSAKRILNHCTRCTRYNARTFEPLMGQLPSYRITESKPFLTTGLDFAGPVTLRPCQGRGRAVLKGYIAVFVCCSTKAIHLELIMSLSVDSLISGLRRFVARRGKCSKFLSDNGRNFVGCRTFFKEFLKHIESVTQSPDLKSFLADSFMEWEFIPAYAPHFGGLWESAVKSVKRHLLRTFNAITLTIEEFETTLCQIESILNSRPLTPLSFVDPLNPLTPAHLLTGAPVSQFPDLPPTKHQTSSQKLRHETLTILTNSFWRRWRNEYLGTMMRSPKWHSPSECPVVGDLVLIKRKTDPPRYWAMGKIAKLYPGKDGIIRVVDVQTKNSMRREALRNLVPLHLPEMTTISE